MNYLLILSLFFSMTTAWWRAGHNLVARVAYEEIMNTDPSVMEKINSILSYLKPFTEQEDKYPLVECANFADLLIYSHFKQVY